MTLSHTSPTHHYIRLAMEPRCTDVLRIRKSIQDALTEMFGLTFASTYIDVLSVDELGSETVIRISPDDAPKFLAAIVGVSRASIKYSAVKESSFLPSLIL
ncbi:hypothetical protein JVU11DRAFT_11670 [Chiua virens]|nr:hypothetical protein JVU11DRAFT_11670 [Chiua virens]